MTDSFNELWARIDEMFHHDQDPLITQLEAINRETVIEKRAANVRAERAMDDMKRAAAEDAIRRLDEALP